MRIDPATCAARDVYRLMVGSIVPRPIAWVSTRSPGGGLNLAPFSFFTGVCEDPPTLCFSVLRRDSGPKDTLRNIRATREFVVNVVSEELGPAMDLTATDVPREVDEFRLAGLTPRPGDCVAAPLVAEAPISMECRVSRLVGVGRRGGGACLVLGEIVRFHVRYDLYDDGRIDPRRLRPIGRLAGRSYARLGDVYEIAAGGPRWSPEQRATDRQGTQSGTATPTVG